jgi:mannosyltransferase OCH1-like enzyme
VIPKIIHQIWLGDKNEMPVELMKTVKDMHFDWKYILWTEENIGNLMNHDKFKIINDYNKSIGNKFTNLADIIRYEKLFEYGGIYIDADSICNKPFNDLLNNEFFVAYENEIKRPGLIANGIIGSVPHYPILEKCIDNIKQMKNNLLTKYPSFKTTGPVFLTRIINEYGKENITIYPSWYFFPVHYTGYIANQKIDPEKDSYTNQLWLSTEKGRVSIIKRFLNRLKRFEI